MYLNLLHLDDALKSQPRFIEACASLQVRETEAQTEGALVRLWGKDDNLEALGKQLSSSIFRNCANTNNKNWGTVVTFMGSGDFHHVSALLLGMLTEASITPVTVIHFDNHPDWVHFKGGMHCGSWVNRALALPQVEKVITIGVTSRDLVRPHYKGANLKAWDKGDIHLLPWRSPGRRFRPLDISNMGEDQFLQALKPLIKTRNVYITIDKDVLSHADAITNWDQGQMPLSYLVNSLRFILTYHHAIGIDVTGDYSPAKYAGRRHHVALKKLESLIDQPKRSRHFAKAAEINQASNMALLDCIREAV